MTDKLLQSLKDVDPVDGTELRRRQPPDAELAAILASEYSEPRRSPERGRRPWMRRRRLVPAAGVAAAVIVAVAASLPGGEEGASPEAQAALINVAALASAHAAPPAAGEFAYTRVRTATVATTVGERAYSWREPTTIETWIAPDGSGRVREVERDVEWPGSRDRDRWQESGAEPLPEGGAVHERSYGAGELIGVPREAALPPVSELPTDADALGRIFSETAERSSDSVPENVKAFEYAASILLYAGSNPDLKSALYSAVAEIDGVELTGEFEDPLGRPGTAVSIVADYSGAVTRSTLIFDDDTSFPLAYTEELVEPQDWIDSTTLGYTTLAESGQVASADHRP